MSLLHFIQAFDEAKLTPYDQAAHERAWQLGDRAAGLLDETERLMLGPWIPPFSSAVPEMAFCRLVDGWKFYLEEHLAVDYGPQSRAFLTDPHKVCDDCVNALRNLFVHSGGFLEVDEKGNNRLAKFTVLAPQAEAQQVSTNALLRIPARILALEAGDLVMLNFLEVAAYADGIKEMLYELERRPPVGQIAPATSA